MAVKPIYLFVTTFLLAVVLTVLLVSPSLEFRFKNVVGDCSGRSLFMYNAIYKNDQDAEVIFIGSSKTMNAINDSMMSRLGSQTFLNLGYCRFGRNLDYFFIEQYCKTHHPKKLVLEVREREGDNSHAVAPFFLPLDQLLADAFSFNGDLFPDLYNKWLCNLKFIRSRLFNTDETGIPSVDPHCGFFNTSQPPDLRQISEQKLKEERARAKNPGLHHEPLNRNAALYFKKIKALCEAHHIRLYFLYLSSYANLSERPYSYDSYRSMGTYLSLPDSMLQNLSNFHDFGHFNPKGAGSASRYLLGRLKD